MRSSPVHFFALLLFVAMELILIHAGRPKHAVGVLERGGTLEKV